MSIKRIPIAIGIKPNQVATFTNKTISGLQNTLTNIPNSALTNNSISINGNSIPLGANINLQVEGGAPIIDTNTTYSVKASSVSGGATIDLDAGGSGTGTDSIKFEGGGAVTVTRVDANTIRISDVGSLGGVALTSENVATLSNKTISGSTNTLVNIPNNALVNNSITINNQTVSLGGSVTIAGGGSGSPNTTETLTNKTISGAENTLTNIPNSALLNPLIIINGTPVTLGTSFNVSGLGDVTLTGEQTLSNKSLVQPIIDRVKLIGTVTVGSGAGSVGANGQVLKSTGTGVQWGNENRTTETSLSIGTGLSGAGGSEFNGSNGITVSIDTTVVATLTGSQTLTNKTLTTPVISSISNSGTLTLPTATDTLIGRQTTDTLSNKTIQNLILSGTVNAGGGIGASGQVLTSTGSGVQWSSISGGGGGASNLDGLVDVVISSPTNGQVLKFNGSNWINDTTLTTRNTANGTASALAANTATNVTFSVAKSFALLKIQTSCAAWVRIYSDSTSRTADQSRDITSDPASDVNMIAEVVTTSAQTQVISPGVIGFNNDDTPTDFVYLRVTNRETSTQNVQVTLTYLPLE
jgi:hypothetical protein